MQLMKQNAPMEAAQMLCLAAVTQDIMVTDLRVSHVVFVTNMLHSQILASMEALQTLPLAFATAAILEMGSSA